MNKISVNELEQEIEAWEEVIDTYFSASITRIGKVFREVFRIKNSQREWETKVTESVLKWVIVRLLLVF